MHVSADLVRGHCFDYTPAVSFPPLHTEKSLYFGPELQENVLFDFVSHGCETSVRPNTSKASLLWDDVVLKWAGTLDYSDSVHVCVCVCVRVCHAFYISVLIQPSSLPLPALIFYSHIFQSCTPLPRSCLWESSYNTPTHPPACHHVWKTAVMPPN